MSPLTQGRGLKPITKVDIEKRLVVAPHAGAWIETGLRTDESYGRHVAPHAGAWIETS